MSVRYKKYQIKMKSSKNNGKWYGRAVSLGHVKTKDLATEISHSTTVTRADVMAVLIELSESLRRHLQNSMTVDLEGLGSFRVGMKTSVADKPEDFKTTNIKGYNIIYKPERKFVLSASKSTNGHRHGNYVKTLLDGITAEALSATGTAAAAGSPGGTPASGRGTTHH